MSLSHLNPFSSSKAATFSAIERESVLNAPAATLGACVHELFAAQAKSRPEAIALIAGSKKIAYGELHAASTYLAKEFRQAGVGHGTPVGLLMERDWTTVLAMLAVLEAGGCYLPLDAGFPATRTKAILADAKCRLVLTQESLADKLELEPETAIATLADDGQLTWLDSQAEKKSEKKRTSGSEPSPESLCYIMNTSGSTGIPKAVAVPHRAVARLVGQTNYLKFSPEDVFLHYAPLAFDASTLEIWGPLCNGASVVLAPSGKVSTERIAQLVETHEVTTLWMTAGLFHQMVDQQLDALRGLKYLLAGGDVLSPVHVARALDTLPSTTLINGYGPTENTTFTTCHVMPPGTKLTSESVPIGVPITGTSVVLLDETQQPVGEEVVAELYTGGLGLAHGYLGQSELTADRFITDPRGTDDSVKLYRTGDLAHWGADGLLYFVGRVDHQVKVRGYRIELPEIEIYLLRHPNIAQCVVIARDDQPGEKRLVAYYVLNQDAETQSEVASNRDPLLTVSALREFLAVTLPEYMIPAIFQELSALPLNVNGKVDRQQLPAPGAERPELAEDYAPAGDELQQKLLDLWSCVLGIDEIGIADHFVELGGDSLLAAEIARRATLAGIPLTPQAMFDQPTVELLSTLLRDSNTAC